MDSLYLAMFEECRRNYERALELGKREEAIESALRCARILRMLAQRVPRMRAVYEEKAGLWEKAARELMEARPEKVGAGSPANSPLDSYRAYVEGLISRSPAKWSDIGGLDGVKKALAQTVAIALARKPEVIKPWKGILLFGPPGTGKTLLASAAAGSLNATFFNVKASDVLSKYYGESSKIISALYSLARERAPSIIFMDEIDALTLRREGAHEATRRTLATLLFELDGFKGNSEAFVLTLAATNTPWDLDEALLSRFPLRIYVPLPDENAVKAIVRIHTRGLDISKLNLDAIARESVRRLYSGREVANLCSLAVHHMLEEENEVLGDLEALSKLDVSAIELKTRPLEMGDFEVAFRKIKSPLTRKDVERYEKWAEELGNDV